MRKSVSVAAIVAVVTLVFTLARAADKPAVGKPAPEFSLQSQDGKTVKLSDYKGKLVVLEWTNPECPFVKRHYEHKTMNTLADEYKDNDVVWLAINSTSNATSEANRKWSEQAGLSRPVLDDSKGTVGRLYGATNTPHMYIVDKGGNLAYIGAIDNDPDGSRDSGKVNYVKKALDELLAGKSVSEPETKAYGCGVHYAE